MMTTKTKTTTRVVVLMTSVVAVSFLTIACSDGPESSSNSGASGGPIVASCGGAPVVQKIENGTFESVAATPGEVKKTIVIDREKKTLTRSYTSSAGKKIVETWSIK